MATASVSTPLKSHHGIFSTKTAGGRMPLTPSPRARTASLATNTSSHSSPFTPPRQAYDTSRGTSQSVYGGNLASHFARSVSRSVSRGNYRDSPKSNIAKNRNSPRHLELCVSDWTLTGTGPSAFQTPSKERAKKDGALRSRAAKTIIRLPHNV